MATKTQDQSESLSALPPIKLNQKQDSFIFATDPFVCIKGTWGCGKSLAGLIAADRECRENPGNLYLITRKEWVDLRDSTMRDWATEIGMPIVNGEVRYPNGSILMFRHGDDLNSLKNTNLGGALMVQAEEESEATFWFLKGRLRRKEGTRQLRLECNHDGKNWIYRLFNKEKIGTLITTNTFDNAHNLPADYIPGLQKMPRKIQEIHLYGSDAEVEGLVWDEYQESKHIVQPFPIPKEWEISIILDHGVTNPTAILWAAVDFDGNCYLFDEHYERQKPISYHAEQIQKRIYSYNKRLIDPACRAKTIPKNGQFYSVIDEYHDYLGWWFDPADNNVLAGINRVNEYLKSGKLFIFKNCFNLIDEIGQYKWQRLKPGEEKNEPDKPVKQNDHLCDCLRYFIMSRPQVPSVKERVLEGTERFFEMQEERQRSFREEIESLDA